MSTAHASLHLSDYLFGENPVGQSLEQAVHFMIGANLNISYGDELLKGGCFLFCRNGGLRGCYDNGISRAAAAIAAERKSVLACFGCYSARVKAKESSSRYKGLNVRCVYAGSRCLLRCRKTAGRSYPAKHFKNDDAQHADSGCK